MFRFAQLGGLCNGGWRGAGHGAQRQTPLRGEGGGVFVWSLPANARMGPVNIVVITPVGQGGAGMGQRRDQGFVQQLVAQPPIEAFDKGVLRGLARCDAVPVDLAFVGEGESRVRGELGAVIRDDLDCTGFVPVRCSC